MYRPNQSCTIRLNTEYSLFGTPIEGRRKREKCAIVRLLIANEKSSVRADSSASRGNARELQSDSLFLFGPQTAVEIDSVVELLGDSFRVTSKQPRFDMRGRLDHFEVGCSYWSDNEPSSAS